MKASRRNVRAGVFWRYSFQMCRAMSWGVDLDEDERDEEGGAGLDVL